MSRLLYLLITDGNPLTLCNDHEPSAISANHRWQQASFNSGIQVLRSSASGQHYLGIW